MQVPVCLLDAVDPCDHAVVDAWWSALSEENRDALRSVLAEEDFLPTFPFELEDERASQYLEDAGDRYEYLVNHEIRPDHTTMVSRGIPLPAVALLAPLWPPYPAQVRFQPWSPTKELYRQLRSELDRYNRGNPPREEPW